MRPPASSSSFSFSFTYDVFLSFRGLDTRYGFTGNLHKALSDKGIRTFIDDEMLQKGEEITPTLLKAIQESRIAIIVFSKNDASSTFCLKELVKILECLKRKGRLVWPVFYEVDPSDVRRMKGCFGEAMAEHEARFGKGTEKVEKWKLALQEAANLSGWHFQHRIEYEHKFIEKIVKGISRRTSRIILPIADYPIGLESQVQEVNSLLDVGSNEEVIMVGIYGTGGIGKTTIARAIYNLIADKFDGVCFLADVRETSNKRSLIEIQETMLSKIVAENDIKLTNLWEGISIIKSRLSRKKILLILDDVDKWNQLETLVGACDWFGPGSRIVITTRDEHLLRKHGIERKYAVKTLTCKEAHELLTWFAFKGEDFDSRYTEVLQSLVSYCSGIPLALKVMGCHLFGRSLDQWKSALYAYENVPKRTIQKNLMVSYDNLGDFEKEIFLDMACVFKGYELKYVENVLLTIRGSPPQDGIAVLVDRSLIKIDSHGIVRMHDLIEDMGKEIVRKQSPLEPGKRSRLWSYEDVLHVFEENTGTDNIQAIVLHSNEDTKVYWDGNAFEKMTNLKILIITGVSFSTAPNHLPNTLRYLKWEKYQWSELPSNFNPRKLVILGMKSSFLTSFQSLSNFKLLSQINLRESKILVRVPDLSEASNLRKLNLDYCTNLIEVHTSVGALDKLCLLSARGCTNLKNFPEAIKSTSLKYLRLSSCSSLKCLPVMPGIAEKITKMTYHGEFQRVDIGRFEVLGRSRRGVFNFELHIGTFNLPKVEKIIENLGHLRKCRVQDHEGVSSAFSSNIRSFEIYGSNFPIGNHSKWLPCCTSMEELDFLCNCSTHECLSSWLPSSPSLEVLRLFSRLDVTTWLPSRANLRSFVQKFVNFADEFVFTCLRWMPKLQELYLHGIDFTILPECINECHFLRILKLDDCKQLREIKGMPPNIEYLSAVGCTSLSAQSRSMLLSQTLHKASTKEFVLPGIVIPKWFDYRQSTAESLSFWVRNQFPERILFCFVHSKQIQYDLFVNGINCSKIKTDIKSYTQRPCIHLLHIVIGDEELIGDRWTRVEFSSNKSYVKGNTIVSCMGVHVYDKRKNSRKDVRFTDPNIGKSKVDEHIGDINPNYHPLLKTWKMQILANGKILLCQIEGRCLPTCHYLFSRELIKSPLCPICETEYETIEHAFLFCPWTRAVWFGSGHRWTYGQRLGNWLRLILLWGYSPIEPEYKRIPGVIVNICWAIWKGRNEYILEGKPVDPALALLRIKTLHDRYSHSGPLVQKSDPTSKITYQDHNGLLWFHKSEIGESSGTKEEVGTSYDETKTSNTLDSMVMDSTIQKSQNGLSLFRKSEIEEVGKSYDKDKGKSTSIAGNNNNEVETIFSLDSMMVDSTIHDEIDESSSTKEEVGTSYDETKTSNTLDSMMMDSTIQKKEVGTSYDKDKGTSMSIAGNGNDEAETIYSLDSMIANSTIHNDHNGLSWFHKSEIGESNDTKEEVSTSYDETETSYSTLDSMVMDSTIHKKVRESDNEGNNIVVAHNGNTEVNERHKGCSWLIEFAIQLLRCLPLREVFWKQPRIDEGEAMLSQEK